MTSEITCLIVDDHEVVREGLRLSLSRSPHIRVVGEAPDGAAAVVLAERRRPDVVIMDVRAWTVWTRRARSPRRWRGRRF
jgi:DNA-binding NarL/FixJ family response regulator